MTVPGGVCACRFAAQKNRIAPPMYWRGFPRGRTPFIPVFYFTLARTQKKRLAPAASVPVRSPLTLFPTFESVQPAASGLVDANVSCVANASTTCTTLAAADPLLLTVILY